MPERPIGVYALALLARIVAKHRSLPEVRKAIAAHPEDARREGPVKAAMAGFVAGFAAFEELDAAVRALAASHGGQEGLDGLQEHMEFNEFMAGWDDER